MKLSPSEIHSKKAELTSPGSYFEAEYVLIEERGYKTYKNAPKTLVEVMQAGRGHGDTEFLVYQNYRYTFTQFYQEVDALAAALQGRYGVRKGDRLAIAMRNTPEWLMAYVAGTLIGAVLVPINSWGTADELLYALTDSGARVIICDEARFNLLEASVGSLDIDVLVARKVESGGVGHRVQALDSVLAGGAGLSYSVAEVSPLDHCIILYTSGSTGVPKGVQHRHIAVCQALMNMFFLGMLVRELEGERPLRGGAEREAPLLTVPLFHATGLLAGFLIPLQMGHKVVMMHKWDALVALQLIQDEKVTALSSVPTVVQDLLHHPAFDDFDTSSLIRVAAAGAATPAGLPELICEKVGSPSRSAGYGMTETMAVAATMSGAIFDLKPESAGIVSPIMEMRFVDAGGVDLPAGKPGEIELYSVCCTPGYWNSPAANAATFDEEGWMKTGDVGFLDDDGFLHITGRTKEIVIRGGENIYPAEIEQVAYEINQIQEIVVFGVPDKTMGEELAMVYFCTPGAEIEDHNVRKYLQSRAAAYKVPKHIQLSRKPLPQNASGKLHKQKIRQWFIDTLVN